MLKLKTENEQIDLENTQLKSSIAISTQDLKLLKFKYEIIQENRDNLENQLSILQAENEKLKLTIQELEMNLKGASIEVENSDEKKKKIDEECEFFSETGPDFDSKWFKNVAIVESNPNFVVLKNQSRDQHQCLDDFLFSRIVDGKTTVPGIPLPLGIILPPQSTYTIHSNHPKSQEIDQKSCVMFRYETFGAGKVTENVLLDEEGDETANYVLCVFQG